MNKVSINQSINLSILPSDNREPYTISHGSHQTSIPLGRIYAVQSQNQSKVENGWWWVNRPPVRVRVFEWIVLAIVCRVSLQNYSHTRHGDVLFFKGDILYHQLCVISRYKPF